MERYKATQRARCYAPDRCGLHRVGRIQALNVKTAQGDLRISLTAMMRLAQAFWRPQLVLVVILSTCAARAGIIYAPSPIRPDSGFVTANGTEFVLRSERFYFVGTNAWYLARPEAMSDDQISKFFERAGRFGFKVIRFFGFSNGQDGQTNTKFPIQPTLGHWDEHALQRIDLILREAGKHGVRLLLTLSNFEPFLGGWQWWVDQILGPGHPLEQFMVDDRVKRAFKAYVKMLLTRRNVYTGLIYRSDPTIFAVELANEPHTRPRFEQLRGLTPGSMALAWLTEMAAFVRGIDKNHMISTGEEGYRADGPTDCCFGDQWLNGGFKGVDFVKNVALPNISFATIHLYPDNWKFEPYNYEWIIPHFLEDRAAIAHSFHKPIIMEEFGMQKGWLSSRDTLLEKLGNAALEAGYAGMMVWQMGFELLPRFGTSKDYNFLVGEQGTAAVEELVSWSHLSSY